MFRLYVLSQENLYSNWVLLINFIAHCFEGEDISLNTYKTLSMKDIKLSYVEIVKCELQNYNSRV